MRRKSLAVSVASAAAAVLALSACGSSTPKADSATVVAQAVGKTTSAKNADVTMDLAMSSSANQLTLHGSGVTDLQHGTFKVSFPLPASSGVSGSLDELVVGKAVYLRLPPALRSRTAGKEWVVIVPSTPGFNAAGNPFGQDLSTFLDALGSAGHNVSTLGQVDVRGVRTTHYRAVADMAKAAKMSQLSGTALDQYRAMYGTKPMTVDVYLDGQGLVRRMSMDLAPEAAGGPTSERITLDFYDFGRADTSGIIAPPKSDTVDVAQTTFGRPTG